MRASSLLLVAVIVSVGSLLAHQVATAESDHRIIIGIHTTRACITTGWHPPDGSKRTHVDVVHCYPSYPQSQSGVGVSWQSHQMSGTKRLRVTVVLEDPGACKGVQLLIESNGSGADLATYRFIHVDESVSAGQNWATTLTGFTIVPLGTVATTEGSNCPWYGAHVHQGGDVNAYLKGNPANPPYTYNQCAGQPNPCPPVFVVSPTGDYENMYEHRVEWGN